MEGCGTGGGVVVLKGSRLLVLVLLVLDWNGEVSIVGTVAAAAAPAATAVAV